MLLLPAAVRSDVSADLKKKIHRFRNCEVHLCVVNIKKKKKKKKIRCLSGISCAFTRPQSVTLLRAVVLPVIP